MPSLPSIPSPDSSNLANPLKRIARRNDVNNVIEALKPNKSLTLDDIYFEMKRHPALSELVNDSAVKKDILTAIKGAADDGTVSLDAMSAYNRLDRTMPPPQSNLYKTDIPDEAVARFLDWDKPLSQQAPEVQKALGVTNGYFKVPTQAGDLFAHGDNMSGVDLINELSSLSVLGGKPQASEFLKQKGIPGIRYLDGGSRASGGGTSNFVLFDPELIRIIERNGNPTGAVPW